jgi:Kelch motif
VKTTRRSRLYKKLRSQYVRLRIFLIRHDRAARITAAGMLVVFISSTAIQMYNLWNDQESYQLSSRAEKLLGETNEVYASQLKLSQNADVYEYNAGYTAAKGDVAGDTMGARFTAQLSTDPAKGMTVIDPIYNTSIAFKPDYKLGIPIQDQNRLIYPLRGKPGAKVMTLKAGSTKEDIILEKFAGDELSFAYDMELPDELEARLEDDGSLGVYGPGENALYGSVSTGSEKDQALLEKARQKAAKTQLVFRVPAPFIVESNNKHSGARTWYGLDGNKLTIYASGLEGASYPLTIDPSVYIETAAKLMRGNNESNIDFDVDNELIQKGKTTGARFDSWTSTLALPAARWNHGTAVAGGFIYVVGGNSGSAAVGNMYWAKINNTTGAIEAANPGNGACSDWCTDAAYNLPSSEVRDGASVVAYNGYIYVIGGRNAAGTRTNTVYISKIGANGEPQLWHPTDTNKANWVYWYSDTALSTERAFAGAVAYNNSMYLLGGQTTANPKGVDTVQRADITPTGKLASWSATGMVVLPSARHNHTVQVYNDRIYLIGGQNSSDVLQSSVHYIKINSDGSMAGSWVATTSFTTARMSWGGNFGAIWGGYIYLGAGCTAVNASGYCTTINGTMQVASINADGSLTDWQSLGSGADSTRLGYGLVTWRDTIYGIGGCTAQNTTTGACTTTATLTQIGDILQDGEASAVRNSVASGTSPCVSTGWTNCNMPPLGNGNGEGGQLAGGAVVNNGYIYYMGGCYSVGNGSVCFTGNAGKSSDTIFYSAIAADGTLVRGPSCVGTYYGSWCVDNTNTLNGTTGLSAFGISIFNNVIYVVGGTTGTQWQDLVWRNPLNADGSLGTWTSQTFTNLDLGNAKGYQYVFTRANPASAGTYPGNLYVVGGCSGVTAADDGLDCTGNTYTEVYKCNITTTGALEEADANDCTTTGQVQLDSETGTSGSQGLGVMAGTVYANYVYLIGGQSPNQTERGQVMYAKIDNSNNIVDVDGETVTDNIWETSPNEIDPVRRRSIAFGYNGYLYALAGYNTSGGGSLNDLLFAKIDVSDGSIDPFVQSTVTVTPRWDLRAIVNNGYVYTMGGCSVGTPPASCTTTTAVIQTFQLYNNYSGSPKSYSATSLFTTDRIGASSTVLNGRLYLAGGCSSATDCTTAIDTVQHAAINPDGTLGTWAATTAVMPSNRAWGQLETVGGTLYWIGGQSHTATDERAHVYYGTPVTGGNVTAWTEASNILPAARTKISAAVWNNRIYVVGGLDSNAAPTTTVYVSPSLSSGGNITSAWTTTTSFNVARSGTTAVAYANNLYIFGGYTGSQYLNDAQYTQINSDGTLDSWAYTTSLPGRLSQADGFAANGFMYLFGGRSADTTCVSNTIVAPISANTTIATGNNPTGIGEWFETSVRYTGDRYGASAVYNDGKAYLLGGGCGATITYTGANRVVQSTLQAQPQIAKYSRLIDTDTDVFPTGWLMNGLDNATGAEWYMRYRSMNDIDGVATDCGTADMSTWGQDTNFGKVTLGRVEGYTPKDGSGTNIDCARYYYLTMTIDSQRAYGYPEDVERGPTIADLSLFYVADPSKRLRHGKTFTGGEQQPLDTPCRYPTLPGGSPDLTADPNRNNCPLPASQ